MKKISKILVILLMLLVACSCSKNEKPKEEVYIVFTSDVHCGIDENFTFASLKAYVNDLKAEHNNVLLVDCGDFIQGGTIGTLSKGEYIIELMNDMEYDLVTYGNHEFDYGPERLKELLDSLNCKKVISNVKYTGSKINAFEGIPEYVIYDFNGTKVGFIGVLTPQTITESTPAYFKEGDNYVYSFYDGEEGSVLQNKVQEVVDEVRKQGADYVIALTHLGSVLENSPYDSISLISHTSGIDAVIDGHSHSLITEDKYPNKDGEDVILSSVGTKLQEVGTLIIDPEGNMQVIHMETYDKKDEAMQNSVNEVLSDLDGLLNRHITDVSFDLKISDEEDIRMVRARETNMADFVTDAIRETFDADIVLDNGGGIRANILAGEVVYNDLFNVTPFQNKIISIYATGQQIVDCLEFASKDTQAIYKFDGKPVGEFGGFLQVSGLKYTIDTSVETAVTLDENEMFAGFSNDNRRVKDVYVLKDGEYVPIDLNETYKVAGIDYVLISSGNGNTVLKDCEVIDPIGMLDIDLLVEYTLSHGIDEKYQNVDNRITIV